MPDETLPIDFRFAVNIGRANGYPVQVRYFVRKPHDIGALSKTVDLQHQNPRLRSMVEESIKQRYGTDTQPLRVSAQNRRGLEMTIEQDIPRHFSIIMLTDEDDSRIVEAVRILMKAITPNLDAAEMLELTQTIPLS